MEKQAHTGLLKISLLFFITFIKVIPGIAQKNVRLLAGAGLNQVFSSKANASDLKNEGKGESSFLIDVAGTLKFSKHISFSLSYQRLKNTLKIRFENVEVVSFNYQSVVGNITFEDRLHLYANQLGLNLNFESPFDRNNIVLSLGINRAYYNSKQNYVDRHYESVPANSSFSNLERKQNSYLTGPQITALNASLMYERMLYKDRIGLAVKVDFIYNFISHSYEYTHADMGWENGYHYTFGVETISSMKYYRLSYNTLNFTMGFFYKLNFGKHENQ